MSLCWLWKLEIPIPSKKQTRKLPACCLTATSTMSWDDQSVDMVRPNPFDYNPWCLLVHKQTKIVITAKGPSNIYVQKTLNDKTEPEFPNKLFRPEDTDTWARGTGGVLQNCIKRDVRTCFDLDIAPYSNMVLGEVINLPGQVVLLPADLTAAGSLLLPL